VKKITSLTMKPKANIISSMIGGSILLFSPHNPSSSSIVG
jgi:hypothetical protein